MREYKNLEDQSRDLGRRIRDSNRSELPDLYVLDKPLHKVLWVLAAVDGIGWRYPMFNEEIRLVLEEFKVALTPRQPTNALSRAGDKVIRKDLDGQTAYRIAQPGLAEVQKLFPREGIEVIYAEPGKKWTARKKLNELAMTVDGDLLIADRYYGERSLYVLEELAERKGEVRFLTCETRESVGKLRTSFHDLMKEKQNLEVRIYPHKYDLHDRFILGDNALIIVGHGIKDLGGSESFVIRISDSTAKDLMALVRSNFESRWQRAAGV